MIPKLRAALVRMARGYISSEELRLRAVKALRTLVVVHSSLVPPDSLEGYSDKEIAEWRTEYDVIATLRKAGHTVQVLGVLDSLTELRAALVDSPPDVVFNLLEEFNGIVTYDQHVVAFLELMRQPYTGCNPRGLLLSRDKVLCKQVLAFHRIPTPQFAVFRRGRALRTCRAGCASRCSSSRRPRTPRSASPRPRWSRTLRACASGCSSCTSRSAPMRWSRSTSRGANCTSA